MQADQNQSSPSGADTKESARPVPNQKVILQCANFTCVGYCDSEGNWRAYFGNEIIRDVVEWRPL